MSSIESSYIAGEWTGTGRIVESLNPARPSEIVVVYHEADPEDVSNAVRAASEATRSWGLTPAPERGKILRRAAGMMEADRERLGRIITLDTGKTLAESAGELDRAIETLFFHSAQGWAANGETFPSYNANERISAVRLPIGVVGVITPFNFPLVIAIWKIGPALVNGNTVVWKPADAAPAVAFEVVRIFERAGLPPGVLNLVIGGAAVGTDIVSHASIDAVTFTGSVPVGQSIAAITSARGARAQLELGGHNAAIVFADANLALAARHVAAGAMLGAGQKCTSTRRTIVHARVYDEFAERLLEEVGKLRIGDGETSDVDLGPVISGIAKERILQAVATAEAEGAHATQVGNWVDTDSSAPGHFIAPVVLRDVTRDMAIAQQEVFGPVISLIQAADDDEAIAIANSTRFGLSTSIFTSSESIVRRCVNEIEVGVIHVNNGTTGASPNAPFGGRRDSSMGGGFAEQGFAARDFYTKFKTVYAEPAS